MRHGTLTMATTGGCHEPCCARVAARYYKRYAVLKAAGIRIRVPAAPSHRKVQALQALGHTRASIAVQCGMSPQALTNLMGRDLIKARTAARIDEAYRRLEMTVPAENRWTKRARREALELGWPPPLAWEDIEAGVIANVPKSTPYSHARLDWDEIDYALQYHDFSRRLSPREKAEIVRLWKVTGRSERALCKLTGWREGRYRIEEKT